MKIFNFQNISDEPLLRCEDFTLSHKDFELRRHEELDMLVTFPAPSVEELPFFYKSENYISHTDSKKSFLDKLYQVVKKYMLDKKIGWLEKESLPGRKLLDIGAGTGDFLSVAKSRGWNISGVEPDADARNLALVKDIHLETDTNVFPSKAFDVITLWHVLEHIPDLDKQITELKRLLKDDGVLVIAVPNFKSYDAHTYREHWAAFDVPRHLWHFSRTSIQQILSAHSFHLEKDKPLVFDSFYVSLLSEKYRKGNSLKGLVNGLLSNLIAQKTKEYSSLVYFFRKSS